VLPISRYSSEIVSRNDKARLLEFAGNENFDDLEGLNSVIKPQMSPNGIGERLFSFR